VLIRYGQEQWQVEIGGGAVIGQRLDWLIARVSRQRVDSRSIPQETGLKRRSSTGNLSGYLREMDSSLDLDGAVHKISQVCPTQSEPAISRQRLRIFSKTSTGNVPASKASPFSENL
jgi:hypothetical protein